MPLLNKFLHTIYISIIRGIPLILFVVVLLSLSISIIPQGGYSHLTSFLFGMLKTFWLGIVLAIISFNKIWLRIIWLVVTLLITIIYLCLGLKFSVTFTPYVAQLILQTNTAETNEFFGIYIGFKFIIFLSLFFLINLFLYCSSEKLWLKYLRKRKSKYNANFKTSFFIIICLLFPISTITNFTNLASLDLGNKNRNILRRFFFFHKAPYLELWYSFSAGKDNNNNIELIEKGYQELKIDSIKSITPPHICLIIGDSFIKSHSNLYGYRLITNPNLTKENKNGNLIVFNDVISKFSVTRRSVPSILMLENGDCGFSWNKFTNDYDSLKKITLLPSVLKKAGYSVFFLDNQATSIYNEKEFSISYLLNEPSIRDISLNYKNSRTYKYDHEIVQNENIFETYNLSDPTFTIYHLNGQHADAKYRYPNIAEFNHFNQDSIARDIPSSSKQLINYYDNATFYFDYVVKEIIDKFRDKDAIIICTSDHGDCMFDDDNNTFGRVLYSNLSNQQLKLYFEVPLFVWTSDIFKKNHLDNVEKLTLAINKSFQIDNLAHLIIELAGIQCNSFISSKSLINNDYIEAHRIVYHNDRRFEYDKLKDALDRTMLKSLSN